LKTNDSLNIMQKVLLCLSLVLLVSGHAVLKSPKPWNTAASKTSPCGGGTAPTASATTWVPGSTVQIQWQVIAGDGAGAVTVLINTANGNTFSGTGTQIGNPTAVGTSNFAFTVPAVTCTGAGGLCSVQVKSSSNWFSCTSVKIQAASTPVAATSATVAATSATKAAGTSPAATSATKAAGATTAAKSSAKPVSTAAPPTPPAGGEDDDAPTCPIVSGLSFCTMVNGNNVTLSLGDTASQIDDTAKSTFTETLNNPLVFATPNATGCADAFKQLICSSAFPLCGADTACQPNCKAAISKCTIQDSHKGLFDCTQGSPTDCLVAKDSNTPVSAQNTVETQSTGVQIVSLSALLLALFL